MENQIVTVYSNKSFRECMLICHFLDRADIPCKVIELTEDTDALKMVTDWGYTSAPVVSFGNIRFSGFLPGKLSEIIHMIKGGKKDE